MGRTSRREDQFDTGKAYRNSYGSCVFVTDSYIGETALARYYLLEHKPVEKASIAMGLTHDCGTVDH